MKELLLLWGSSGAYGNDESSNITDYRLALDLIEEGAAFNQFHTNLVLYPGHPNEFGVTVGELSFDSALQKVLEECRRIEPHWIIGRSLGAALAMTCLNATEPWVRTCNGTVLWGPASTRIMENKWPTLVAKANVIAQYAKFKTSLVPDYFDALPDVRSLVGTAACNLRFVRGEFDEYNSLQDLKCLAEIHECRQPSFKREIRQINGLDHTPTRDKLDSSQRELYFRSLFEDFLD